MKIYVCEDCKQELVVKYSGLPGNPKARIVSSHVCDAPDEFVQNSNDLPRDEVEEVQETLSKDVLVDVRGDAVKAPPSDFEAGVTLSDPVETIIGTLDEPGDRRDDADVKSTAPHGLHETMGVPVISDLPEEDETGRQEPTGFPGSEGDTERSEE